MRISQYNYLQQCKMLSYSLGTEMWKHFFPRSHESVVCINNHIHNRDINMKMRLDFMIFVVNEKVNILHGWLRLLPIRCEKLQYNLWNKVNNRHIGIRRHVLPFEWLAPDFVYLGKIRKPPNYSHHKVQSVTRITSENSFPDKL